MISFRLVNSSDAPRILEWRNDPEQLKSKQKDKPFTEEESAALTEKFKDSLYVAEIDGTPFGGIKISNRDGWVGLGWSVGPPFRGAGLGKRLAIAAAETFPGSKRALIRSENIASIKCAVAAGYSMRGEKDGYEIWERE